MLLQFIGYPSKPSKPTATKLRILIGLPKTVNTKDW